MNKSLLKTLAAIAVCSAVSAISYYAGYSRAASASQAATASPVARRARPGATSMTAGPAVATMTLETFLKGPLSPDADLLARWAKSLSPEERAAAMSTLQAMPAGQQRDTILGAVIDAWASADPKGFLSSADTVANPRLREGGVTAALQAWAAQNPKEALAWALQNPGPGVNGSVERRYAAAIAGYAAVDPQGAFDTVSALDETDRASRAMKRQAFDAVSNTLADQGNFAAGVTLFEKLPAGQTRDAALTHLVDRWGTAAPVEASGWVAAQPVSEMRNDMSENLSGTWAGSDPAAGTAWAAQIEQQLATTPPPPGQTTNYPGSDPGDILSKAISNWTRYDMNAAGTFLNQIPASPAKDQAVSQFVSRVSQQDPAGGLAWAATITDDRLRQRAIQQAANQWQQQDPTAFNEFLTTTTTLSADQKQTLLDAMQAQNARRNQGGNNGGSNNSGGGNVTGG